MNDIHNYLTNSRPEVAEDGYDSDELTAARIRLGLEKKKTPKKKGRRRRRRLIVMPDFAAKARYSAAEDRVLDEKQAEHKVSTCKYCRDRIWLDLFGEKWKAEGGSVLCGKAPFMSHEPVDD